MAIYRRGARCNTEGKPRGWLGRGDLWMVTAGYLLWLVWSNR